MSLTYTLRRWADPSFDSASEKAAMEQVLEQVESQVPGGASDLKLHRIVIAQPTLHCRVCGRSDERGGFCPVCLADTMA
jgi:rubrerythrin